MAKQTQETQDLKSVNALLDALKEASSLAADKAAKAVIAEASESIAELLGLVESEVSALREEVKSVSAPILHVRKVDSTEVKLDQPAAACLGVLLEWLSIGEYPYLVGPKGSGKTTAAKQAAKVLGLPFYRFQFSGDMTKSDLFGRQTHNGFVDSILVKAAKHGGVLLLDEMDAANEQVLVALNSFTDAQAANGKAGRVLYNSTTGEEIEVHENCVVIGAGNTWGLGATSEYTARNKQDASTIERFTAIFVDYSEEIERAIAAQYDAQEMLKVLWSARRKLSDLGATESISTRIIERAIRSKHALKRSEKEIYKTLFAAWPKGLLEQSGLVDEVAS
jgi:midasin (ATPase involved in ribosome maturation)